MYKTSQSGYSNQEAESNNGNPNGLSLKVQHSSSESLGSLTRSSFISMLNRTVLVTFVYRLNKVVIWLKMFFFPYEMSLMILTALMAVVVLSSAGGEGEARDKRYLVAKLVLENVPNNRRLYHHGRGPHRHHYPPRPIRGPHRHHGNLFHGG